MRDHLKPYKDVKSISVKKGNKSDNENLYPDVNYIFVRTKDKTYPFIIDENNPKAAFRTAALIMTNILEGNFISKS